MKPRLQPPVLLQRFGSLRVIIPIGRKKGQRASFCLCDCGEVKSARISQLQDGTVQSCGCNQGGKIHGMHGTPEYSSWNSLKDRCLNPNRRSFATYKDRGVCDRWIESFEDFYSDMGPRPSLKHTIDRIDNNKGYSPENCRWALPPQQARNKSTNVNLTFKGKTQCLVDWAEELGIKPITLHARIRQYGWSVERALTTPVKARKTKRA